MLLHLPGSKLATPGASESDAPKARKTQQRSSSRFGELWISMKASVSHVCPSSPLCSWFVRFVADMFSFVADMLFWGHSESGFAVVSSLNNEMFLDLTTTNGGLSVSAHLRSFHPPVLRHHVSSTTIMKVEGPSMSPKSPGVLIRSALLRARYRHGQTPSGAAI